MTRSILERHERATNALEAQRMANIALAHKREDPVLWMQSVWCIRGDQTKPYSIEGFWFLKEPLRSTAPLVSLMAGAGVGKTEAFIPWALSRADRGRRVLYLQENSFKNGLIVQERVNPNFRSSPYLRSRNQGDADNISLKKLGPGLVYFLGLNSDSVTRSYHGDDAIYDELDAMEPGRVVDMQKRLASSTSPTIREISNPSRPDYGIHKRYKEGDQRRVHVTCEYCGDEHPLDFSTHIDRKKLALACPCGKPLDRIVRRRWVPTNPKGTHPSYHIHRLLAPALDVPKLVADLSSEDWRTVSAATRMDLGLPYEDKDSGLTDTDLQAVKGPDTWSKYAPGGFMSIDPGGVFDIQIWKKQEPGIKPLLQWVGTVRGWQELYALIEESQVSGGAIDYGPEIKAAEEFCKRQRAAGRFFYRVSYTLSEGAGRPDYEWSKEDGTLIQANRTGSIDTMVQETRQGKYHASARLAVDRLGRWAQHMKSPRRVVEYNDAGKAKTRWDHEETRPDHQFHCTNLACIYRRAVLDRKVGGGITSLKKGAY